MALNLLVWIKPGFGFYTCTKQSPVSLREVEVGLGLRVQPQGQSSENSRKEKEAPGPRGEWDEGRGTERAAMRLGQQESLAEQGTVIKLGRRGGVSSGTLMTGRTLAAQSNSREPTADGVQLLLLQLRRQGRGQSGADPCHGELVADVTPEFCSPDTQTSTDDSNAF